MRQTTMFEDSRYRNVPKLYDEKQGFMVFPFAPVFKVVHEYVAKSTDTIDGLARKFYGDSSYQWAIVCANDLPFPPKLFAGQVLHIPSADEVLNYRNQGG